MNLAYIHKRDSFISEAERLAFIDVPDKEMYELRVNPNTIEGKVNYRHFYWTEAFHFHMNNLTKGVNI